MFVRKFVIKEGVVIKKNTDVGGLTKEELEEFKRLVKETKGIELTDSEAEDQGMRLVTLFELMMKNPITTEA